MDSRPLKLGLAALPLFLATGLFAKTELAPPKADEPYSDGENAFHMIMDTLKAQYLDDGITEDQFYHAASQGLLQFADARRTQWNKLYTPTEHAELMADMRGEVVGIGVDFRFETDSGMGVINDVRPGTPAQSSGLLTGDRILRVDGRSFAGKDQRDMVYAIRGHAGTDVQLTILREADVFVATITRAKIGLEEVELTLLDDGVGYVGIRNFNLQTVQKIADGVHDWAGHGLKAMVFDLRGCTGGSFDAAVQSSALFVPRGSIITKLKKRGGAEDQRVAANDPLVGAMPTSILIDGVTASGCELTAAALKAGREGTLIGTKSYGKWSMQSVEELPNRYAMRFTVASFSPPDGRDMEGKGLEPDLPVAGLADNVARSHQLLPVQDRITLDPQLQAAHAMVLNDLPDQQIRP